MDNWLKFELEAMSIYRHRFTDRDLAIPEVKIDGEDNTVKAIYLKKNSLIQKGIK